MSVIVGPWVLNGLKSQAILEAIVKRLDETLYGKRVVYVEHDSAHEVPFDRMIPSYADISRHCELRANTIFIPAGSGFDVQLHPLMWHRESLAACIDINGDHVTASAPYFFYKDKHRVDYRSYTLTAFRPSV